MERLALVACLLAVIPALNLATSDAAAVTEHISQEEEAYAAERLDKIRRQNRIKAELQAVLDEK